MINAETSVGIVSTEGLGLPLEEALKRAYYYTETGDWRDAETEEWDRWHAVAKIVVAAVAAERERCRPLLQRLLSVAEGVRLYGAPDPNLLASRIEAMHDELVPANVGGEAYAPR